MQKKLDIIATVAIITLALLISVTLLRQHIGRAKARDGAAAAEAALEADLSQGKYVSPPAGYRWEEHSRTLLLALRYGCVHCEHNMSLYRELHDRSGGEAATTSLLSIFPDDAFVAQHDIDVHGLHGMAFLANVDFDKEHVFGTPTVLLVDNHGTILRSWIGELSKDKQDEVMQSIR
jgi:hypothetical protein